MFIGGGDHGLLKWLAIVADVEASDIIVCALGEDVRPHKKEPIVVTQVRIKFCHYSVGVDRCVEVDCEVDVG